MVGSLSLAGASENGFQSQGEAGVQKTDDPGRKSEAALAIQADSAAGGAVDCDQCGAAGLLVAWPITNCRGGDPGHQRCFWPNCLADEGWHAGSGSDRDGDYR